MGPPFFSYANKRYEQVKASANAYFFKNICLALSEVDNLSATSESGVFKEVFYVRLSERTL